jgi:putative holliday junction resolvase
LANLVPHQRHGRILALDVGKKRIGLAVSDELGLTAQGLETLARTRVREDVRALDEVVRSFEVQTLLVGAPLHMSGDESRQSEYTRDFAQRLAQELNLPVIFWDERLTSKEAERLLREAGATLAQKRKAVDRMSAVLLLDSYLTHQQIQSTASGELIG